MRGGSRLRPSKIFHDLSVSEDVLTCTDTLTLNLVPACPSSKAFEMNRTQTSAVAKTGRFLCDEKSDLFTYLWFRYVPLVSQSCRESCDIRHESTCSTKTRKWPPISTRSNALHLSKAKTRETKQVIFT